MNLSNAETMLLALIAEKPMSSSQIRHQLTNKNISNLTTLSVSSFYKQLDKLKTHQLITYVDEGALNDRNGKIYSISKFGKETLKQQLMQFLTDPENIPWKIDISLYNCSLLNYTEIISALSIYRKKLNSKIVNYNKLYIVKHIY